MSPNEAEPGAPHPVLFAAVKRRLLRAPFRPFRLVTTSGQCFDVPTPDHANVFPLVRLIHVATDDGGEAQIHALHVSSIEPLPKRRRSA